MREFVERFDFEPQLSTLDVSQLDTDRQPVGDARSRVSPMVLKLVMISLVAMALIFYFARLRNTEESSGLAPADGRRTSRRLGSSVPKGTQLP